MGCGRHWAVAHSSLPSIASVTVVDSTPSYEVILPSAIWSSSVDMPNLCGQRLEQLGADHLRGALHRAAGDPGVAAAGGRARRGLVGVDGGHVDLLDAQRLLDDLAGQGGEALAGLDGRADDRGDAVVDLDGGRGDLVGALGAEHVDHAQRVADAAADRAGFARALGAAGQQPLVLGRVLGERRAAGSRVRPGGVRRPAPGRSRSGRWAGRRRWPCALRRRSSAGSRPSFFGQLVHLAPRRPRRPASRPRRAHGRRAGCWCGPPSPR